jgi:uncharacterized protein YigE (DUF2233 family)
LQLGPRLIENGSVVVFGNEPQTRTPTSRGFIAKCADATIVVGITETPVSLYHLATYLGAAQRDGGLACDQAVNLSGGGAELLIVKSDDGAVVYAGGNTTVRQAALVAFTRK